VSSLAIEDLSKVFEARFLYSVTVAVNVSGVSGRAHEEEDKSYGSIRWRIEAGRGSGRSRMKLRLALPLWLRLWASLSYDWTT